jgi:acetyl esterase
LNDPLAEPLLADLKNLPPLHITASEFDVLRSDSEELAAKARDAGGQVVEYELWPGMIHASLNLMGWIDAMGPRVDAIGRFLRANSA